MFRALRRRRLMKRPFPDAWLSHLISDVPFYEHLTPELREEFHGYLKIFIAEKRFVGQLGMQITDRVRVIIGALAVRLVLHLGIDCYNRLNEIVVYPAAFRDPRDGTEMTGLAHSWGTVVLGWASVLEGLNNPTDGSCVGTHEFAHVIDYLDGNFDGTPPLRSSATYDVWSDVVQQHFESLNQPDLLPQHRILDRYGTTNPAEFFAVATEAFFEKPAQMKHSLPTLYGQLSALYRFDPATDGIGSAPTGTKIGRNDPCPCGSGKKFKRCHG